MKEYTISGRQANLYGLFFLIPVIVCYGLPYILIWRTPGSGFGITSVIAQNKLLLQQALDYKWFMLLILFGGIIIHELIHGISMACFAEKGFRSISFGFNAKALAPYAHCKEPLTPESYRISLMMPAALLGEIPILIAWFTGNILWMIFGILFLWTASGDCIIWFKCCKIKTGMIQDHPTKIGFIHLEDQSPSL